MLERVVFIQLSSFLSKHDLLDANQSGFDVDIQLRLHYTQSLKPCELQKLIPNHQFSFCWIYLLLLTLFTIRSSCPVMRGCFELRWFESYLNGRSFKVAWGGEVSTEHQLVTGVSSGNGSLTPSSSPHTLHHWVPSYRHMVLLC